MKEKIKTKKLIVIAGPPSSGKSTLISQLQTTTKKPDLKDLASFLKIDDRWTVYSEFEFVESMLQEHEKIIIHYDLLWDEYKKTESFINLNLYSILNTIPEVTILTIEKPVSVLIMYLINGKLRMPTKDVITEHIKSRIFRILSHQSIIWMVRHFPLQKILSFWTKIPTGRYQLWSAKGALEYHFFTLKFYLDERNLSELYSKWESRISNMEGNTFFLRITYKNEKSWKKAE